jgi:hypothetical protein
VIDPSTTVVADPAVFAAVAVSAVWAFAEFIA